MTIQKEADTARVVKQDADSTPSMIVVMGAAVWANGVPSKAMVRRIQCALANDLGSRSLFLLTGGLGQHPPTEAQAMRSLLLQAGIPDERILLDEKSANTLSSVRNCAKIIAGLRPTRVLVCSDIYHIPRCRFLFRLLGIQTESAKVVSGRASNGLFRWLFYYLREALAVPWDTLLLIVGYGK